MNISLSKKSALYIIVLIWIVFSLTYIGYDIWSDFKNTKMVQAYQQGKTDTVNALIIEAEKCQPFVVSNAEKQVQLANLNCQQSSTK